VSGRIGFLGIDRIKTGSQKNYGGKGDEEMDNFRGSIEYDGCGKS